MSGGGCAGVAPIAVVPINGARFRKRTFEGKYLFMFPRIDFSYKRAAEGRTVPMMVRTFVNSSGCGVTVGKQASDQKSYPKYFARRSLIRPLSLAPKSSMVIGPVRALPELRPNPYLSGSKIGPTTSTAISGLT